MIAFFLWQALIAGAGFCELRSAPAREQPSGPVRSLRSRLSSLP